MKKTITTQQIEGLLQAIYQTNIPVAQFDAIRKLFNELPEVKEETKKEENLNKLPIKK